MFLPLVGLPPSCVGGLIAAHSGWVCLHFAQVVPYLLLPGATNGLSPAGPVPWYRPNQAIKLG